MAPAKRDWGDMMLDEDPVFEFEVVMDVPPIRFAKRQKETHADLSTYLMASDDEFDSIAPSAEVLERDVTTDAFRNPFMGGEKAGFRDDLIAVSDSGFNTIEDFSSSDDDTGYATMFSTPEHVLDAAYDVPFIDTLASTDALLVDPTDAAMEEVVRALSAPSSPTPAAMFGGQLKQELEDEDEETPPMSKDGKTPANPTRWAHNSTERKRRLEIRKLFSGLRDLFPDIAGDDKISNITTLNRAIEQVAELKTSIAEREAAVIALRERNVALRSRAAECSTLRQTISLQKTAEVADLPAVAVVVLEGAKDPEVRKQLPAALRQLLDHNSKGPVEQKPLARRRKVAPTLAQLISV